MTGPASPRSPDRTETLLDVLAYLITAARTQLDEAAEYAPMRMLTAAQRLGAAMHADAPTPTRDLIDALLAVPPTATPGADRDRYVAILDVLCTALAECLLAAPEPR
jgi:hypothetical protein